MIDWPAVIKALRGTGYSNRALAAELRKRGAQLTDNHLLNFQAGRVSEPRFSLGDAMLCLLQERDPRAYAELYVQPRYEVRVDESYGGTD